MTPLTFVTWLWRQPNYHTTFEAEHVNALFRMIDRHYSAPHRNLCVTNFPAGIDKTIEIVKDTEDFAGVQNPWGGHMPSCYRRLRIFRADAAKTFGDRIVSMDLDTVIVADLAPLFDRDVDFRIWGQADKRSRGWYNGSLMYVKAGTRTQVWDHFNPKMSPHTSKRANSAGSDQGWIGYILGRKEAMWSTDEGVYSYRVHIAPKGNVLPENARIVNFHGRHNPFDYHCQQIPWVREHYCMRQEEAA
jgi:hypothetical protein